MYSIYHQTEEQVPLRHFLFRLAEPRVASPTDEAHPSPPPPFRKRPCLFVCPRLKPDFEEATDTLEKEGDRNEI
jgi:hypothetical protein